MVNLDVAKRYYTYRVITCCYSVIHKLHYHSNGASYNSTFYHTRWYYEYRKTFRYGLTADSTLHITMNCGRGSLVKLCGLTRIKFHDPHISVDGDTMPAWEPHSQPTSSFASHPWSCCLNRHQPEQRESWVGKVQIEQLGRRGLSWLWHITEAHILMLYACVGDGAAAKSLGLRAETVTVWPSRLSHSTNVTNPVNQWYIGLTTVQAGTTKRIQMWIPI